MEDTKEKISNSDSEKVSGGFSPVGGLRILAEHGKWSHRCSKCEQFTPKDEMVKIHGYLYCRECAKLLTDAENNVLSSENSAKVSGGAEVAKSTYEGSVWKPKCPKCGKEMPGGIGVHRVDGTIYEHPYFCEDCAAALTDEEKNK